MDQIIFDQLDDFALDIISSKSYEPILPQNEIILHFTNFLTKIPTLSLDSICYLRINVKISFRFHIFSPSHEIFSILQFYGRSYSPFMGKSVHRAHNGTRRVSIISNDKETTWGEGEKERGLSKTSRGVRRSLLLSILSGKRREGGTSVEVDKFFYSRKAEKVTVPSLEGKKRRRKRKR